LRLNTLGIGSGTRILDVQSNSTSHFVVRGDGFVGVGTTAPAFNLQVNGSLGVTDGTSTVRLVNSGGVGLVSTVTNHPLAFQTDTTERMRIDTSGVVLIGTTTSTNNIRLGAKLAIVAQGTSTYSGMGISSYSGGSAAVASFIDFNRSGGATDGTMTAVANGNTLGYIVFRGADGTNFANSSQISAEVDGTVSSTAMPGRISFSTSAAGSNTPTERMRIDSSGNVGIGTNSPSTYGKFVVNGASNADVGVFIGNLSVFGSAPTYKGTVRIVDNPTSLSTNGGLEFMTATFGSGYGWKIAAIDSSGVPLVFAQRQNSATWTESMRIDTSGRITAPSQTGFKVNKLSNSQSITGSTWTRVSFNNTATTGCFNTGNAYSTSTNLFTAPVTGKYLFTASVNISAGAAGNMYVDFGLNGSNNVGMEATVAYPAGDTSLTISTVINMAANDTMEVDLFTTNATTAGNRTCGFSGQLLS
jgi:hypothetical protein